MAASLRSVRRGQATHKKVGADDLGIRFGQRVRSRPRSVSLPPFMPHLVNCARMPCAA